MQIAVSGFAPETKQEEISEALENYGVVVNEITIHPSDDPQRFLAVIDVDADETGAQVIIKKIHGNAWKGRRLSAEFFRFFKS